MLTLTRKTDYALIALIHLAGDATGCTSAREVAKRYRMPLPLLMNILKLLTQKGLAKSSRGPRGGYMLARPADQITLNDVIRAVEGPMQLVHCIDHHPPKHHDAEGQCELVASCPVRSPIHRIHDRLAGFLQSITIADLAGEKGCCNASAAENLLVQVSGT